MGGLDGCFCIVITKTSVSNRPFPRENVWAEECPQGGYMKYVLQKLCMRVICSQQRAVKIETF